MEFFKICICEKPSGSQASSHSWWPRHARDCARLSRYKTVYIFLSPFTLFLDDYSALPSLFLNLQNFLLLFSLSADHLASYFTEKIDSIRRKLSCGTPKSTHLPASMPVCSLFPPTPGCTCCWLRPAPPVDSDYSSSSLF